MVDALEPAGVKTVGSVRVGLAMTVESGAVSDRIYRQIKEDIIRNVIEAGSIVVESELAHRYGCSKTPVREALTRLRHEGYVASIPRKGYVVTALTLRDVLEGYHLRGLLEGEAAEMAASRLTAEALRELEACLVARSDGELSSLNRKFHMTVAEAAGNRKLKVFVVHLLEEMDRILSLDPAMWNADYMGEHRDIVEALRVGDGEAARDAMVRHIEASKARVLGRI
jgi:DNA-binding GntR family transcriptional regulator